MSKLTLGPLLFNWEATKRRDFYFRIADEADVERVYLGEVVCSKREPLFASYMPEVAQRLKAAGKEVVLSTLSLVTTEKEMNSIRENCEAGYVIEANDVSCIKILEGRPFVIGPNINVFHEGTLEFLVKKGAVRLVMSMELAAPAMAILAGADKKVEKEVMVFGRQPLAISMRCYHARARGMHKDGCQFVCKDDPDGLPADTIDGQKLFTINGTQTMSHGYVVLLENLAELQKMGIDNFRLSPQDVDMVEVAKIYRKALDKKASLKESLKKLRDLTANVPFINGYINGREGMAHIGD
ncbi:MAG: U32 family peptidase [Alphaproteobacteria bacterium]|nr:U32 family peptidase [Alphaproteobacteria bacterium]